jgi:exopolysaccharide biosynthesis predicted pyruvyltransferase EpsI
MRLLARIRSIYHSDRAEKKQAARLYSAAIPVDFYARD